MANRTKTGVFDADTGGGSQEVTWASPDFTPTFIRLFTQGRLANVISNSLDGVRYSHGFGVSGKVWSCAMASEEDAPTINCSRLCSKTKLLTILDDIGTIVGECTLTSFSNKKFTINWTTTPTATFKVYYQAIDCKNVDVVYGLANTSTGSQEINHTAGFTGNAVMAMGTSQLNLDTMEDDLKHFMGMATGATEELVFTISGEHGALVVTDDRGLLTTAVIRGFLINRVIEYVADFTSFSDGKFTLNWSDAAPSAYHIGYAVFEFDDAKVGTAINPVADTTENTITGLGFTANGLMTGTVQTSGSSADGALQTGAADAEASENNSSVGFYTENGAAIGDSGIFQSNVDCLVMIFSNGSTRADGKVTAYGVGTIEMAWVNVSSQKTFGYLAFNATTASASSGGSPSQLINSRMLG